MRKEEIGVEAAAKAAQETELIEGEKVEVVRKPEMLEEKEKVVPEEKLAEAFETIRSFLLEKTLMPGKEKQKTAESLLKVFSLEEKRKIEESLSDRPQLLESFSREGFRANELLKFLEETLEGRSVTGKYRKVFKAKELLERSLKPTFGPENPLSEERIKLEAYFISQDADHFANKGKSFPASAEENYLRAKAYLEEQKEIPIVSEKTLKKVKEKKAAEAAAREKRKAEREAIKKVRKELGLEKEASEIEILERLTLIKRDLLERFNLSEEVTFDELMGRVSENWQKAKAAKAQADILETTAENVDKIVDLEADLLSAQEDMIRAKVIEQDPKTAEEAEKIARKELALSEIERLKDESVENLKKQEQTPGFLERIRKWWKRPTAKVAVFAAGILLSGALLFSAVNKLKQNEAKLIKKAGIETVLKVTPKPKLTAKDIGTEKEIQFLQADIKEHSDNIVERVAKANYFDKKKAEAEKKWASIEPELKKHAQKNLQFHEDVKRILLRNAELDAKIINIDRDRLETILVK